MDSLTLIDADADADFSRSRRASFARRGRAASCSPVNRRSPHETMTSSNGPVSAAGASGILLQDVTVESYEGIGTDLGVTRWAPATVPIKFPVTGVVWGASKRPMLPLQCFINKRTPIILHMLVDTGSPITLLCADTLGKLGFTENTPSTATVVLHGCRISITLSHAHFANNDVLGADWLAAARACMEVDYVVHTVVVKGSASGDRDATESLAGMGRAEVLLPIILIIMTVMCTLSFCQILRDIH